MTDPDDLLAEAIRGFLWEKHLPFGSVDVWTDELVAIVADHNPLVAELAAARAAVEALPASAPFNSYCRWAKTGDTKAANTVQEWEDAWKALRAWLAGSIEPTEIST